MADLEAIKTQLEDVAKSVAAQAQSIAPSPPKPEVPLRLHYHYLQTEK